MYNLLTAAASPDASVPRPAWRWQAGGRIQGEGLHAGFFDTEFTELFDDPALISIGLIDATGRNTFYTELSDTWQPEDYSDFCRSEVLVHLEGGAQAVPLNALRQRLHSWLTSPAPQVTLLSDSPRDIYHLNKIFPAGLPANTMARILGAYDAMTRQLFNAGQRLHHKHQWRVHHALNHAKANRLAYLKGWLRNGLLRTG